MSIFVVIPTDASKGTGAWIANSGLQHFVLPNGEYVVSFVGTSKELSDRLGISEGNSGNAIVFSVSSYYGRTTPDTWEWIKRNWGA
ncbi:hypothetical protein PspR84_04340 [Pseudomonas sp. R84]|jgi:hypothetical protein|nr:hypothetical protein PspR84_04340 [Pseudomonas sp. R84]